MQQSLTLARTAFITLTIGLFAVALGGTITLAKVLANVPDNSVTSMKISDGEVKMNDLGVNSVTGNKIQNGQVSAEDVSTGFITFARLVDDATGKAYGWDPGNTFRFKIQDSSVKGNSIVLINIDTQALGGSGPICAVSYVTQGMFAFFCNTNVGEGAAVNYA